MSIIVKWAELSKGYYYGEFLQHKPGLGCEVTGDTTDDEALDMLEKLLDKWHIKKTSGTPFEALKPEIVSFVKSDFRSSPQELKIEYINNDHPVDTLTEIQNAPDMATLSSFKLIAGKNPDLYKAYCNRLKHLSA